jgi:hypothetical protein
MLRLYNDKNRLGGTRRFLSFWERRVRSFNSYLFYKANGMPKGLKKKFKTEKTVYPCIDGGLLSVVSGGHYCNGC